MLPRKIVLGSFPFRPRRRIRLLCHLPYFCFHYKSCRYVEHSATNHSSPSMELHTCNCMCWLAVLDVAPLLAFIIQQIDKFLDTHACQKYLFLKSFYLFSFFIFVGAVHIPVYCNSTVPVLISTYSSSAYRSTCTYTCTRVYTCVYRYRYAHPPGEMRLCVCVSVYFNNTGVN